MIRPAATFAALCALLCAGCSALPFGLSSAEVPPYVPRNARGPAEWPAGIRRVAVLPAHDATGWLTPEFAATLDPVWTRSLALAQRAELVAVDRRALAAWAGRETVDSTDALPDGLLARIADATGAQAVLFLDITRCSPYPPLALSFRAKLVTLPAPQIVWAADESFDSADTAVARAAAQFARSNAQSLGDPVSGVQLSPTRFADYAFQSVAALLPPHPPPPTPAAKETAARADNPSATSATPTARP